MESTNKVMVKHQQQTPDAVTATASEKKKVVDDIKKDLLLYKFDDSRFFLWLFSIMILEC